VRPGARVAEQLKDAGARSVLSPTRAPEDAEMRSATRAIRVCVVVESVIYGLRRRPVLNRYCDHATMAAAIAIVTAKDSHTLTSLDPRNP
jgi:hypothetical protein